MTDVFHKVLTFPGDHPDDHLVFQQDKRQISLAGSVWTYTIRQAMTMLLYPQAIGCYENCVFLSALKEKIIKLTIQVHLFGKSQTFNIAIRNPHNYPLFLMAGFRSDILFKRQEKSFKRSGRLGLIVYDP